MNPKAPLIPWKFLEAFDDTATQVQQNSNNSFVTNSSDIVYSHQPNPYIKGHTVVVKISEDLYQAGLLECKNHLHGRVIFAKWDTPLKFEELKTKLSSSWNMIGEWSMVSLGKGYYEFAFSSDQDMNRVCSLWYLNPGFIKMFAWTPDFIPNKHRLSYAQCWIRIHCLPQEYWMPITIFSIAGGIGTPIALDDATKNRSFGIFAKVLVEIDLKGFLPDRILVEREGFSFFVPIEYENVPIFCNVCQTIGHISANCIKIESNVGARIELESDGASNSLMVQEIGSFDNPAVVNDMRIVGKVWADEDDQEDAVTSVLSKSQKKRLKKKATQRKDSGWIF